MSLGGYTSPNVTDDDVDAVRRSSAKVMNVPVDAVNPTGHTATAEEVEVESREARAMLHKFFRAGLHAVANGAAAVGMGVGEQEEAHGREGIHDLETVIRYTIVFESTIEIPLQTTTFTNATELYSELTSLMSGAVDSGDFLTELVTAAAELGIVLPEDLAVEDLAIGTLTVLEPEDEDDDGGAVGAAPAAAAGV